MIPNEVVKMIESDGEINMYAHNPRKPLLEPLSHVRRHCSRYDAKMKQRSDEAKINESTVIDRYLREGTYTVVNGNAVPKD